MAFEGWNINQVREELKCHELRRKWPTFWFYDDVLDENSSWIKDYAALHNLKTIKTQAITSRACPCATIKVVGGENPEQPKQVTTAHSPTRRVSDTSASEPSRVVSQ
jgi:hypothetical protein